METTTDLKKVEIIVVEEGWRDYIEIFGVDCSECQRQLNPYKDRLIIPHDIKDGDWLCGPCAYRLGIKHLS